MQSNTNENNRMFWSKFCRNCIYRLYYLSTILSTNHHDDSSNTTNDDDAQIESANEDRFDQLIGSPLPRSIDFDCHCLHCNSLTVQFQQISNSHHLINGNYSHHYQSEYQILCVEDIDDEEPETNYEDEIFQIEMDETENFDNDNDNHNNENDMNKIRQSNTIKHDETDDNEEILRSIHQKMRFIPEIHDYIYLNRILEEHSTISPGNQASLVIMDDDKAKETTCEHREMLDSATNAENKSELNTNNDRNITTNQNQCKQLVNENIIKHSASMIRNMSNEFVLIRQQQFQSSINSSHISNINHNNRVITILIEKYRNTVTLIINTFKMFGNVMNFFRKKF